MAALHFVAVIICMSLGVYGASVSDTAWYEEVPTTMRWTTEVQEEFAEVDETTTLTAEAEAAAEKAKQQAVEVLHATEMAAIEVIKAGLNPETQAQLLITTIATDFLLGILREVLVTRDRAVDLGASKLEEDETVNIRLKLLNVSHEVLARAHKDAVQQCNNGVVENSSYKLAELMTMVELARNLLLDLFSCSETNK